MSEAERVASMSPDELIAAITAGLDADEQAAREAGNRRWLVEDNMISLWPEREDDGFMSWPTRADARHAYRHDPSRVLADVQAKRDILAEHPRPKSLKWAPDDPSCPTCDEPWPCRTVRALARPYLAQETS